MTEREIYEKARNSINDEYSEKTRKALKRSMIGFLTLATLGISSLFVGYYKLRVLKEDSIISKEYKNDLKAISYFKEELGEYETKTLNLNYLSKGLKEELDNVYDTEGSKIVPGLEKTIEIIQKDISRINNSQEFKEYTKKANRLNNIYGKGGFGLLVLGVILGFTNNFLGRFYRKTREKKLKALDQEWLS